MPLPAQARTRPVLLGLTLLTGAALTSLTLAPDARAQLMEGETNLTYYIIEVHHDNAPPTRVGAVVGTGSSSYVDANSNTWAANSLYWFWEVSPAWPTINSSGDDGFRLRVAPDQGDVVEVDPDEADAVYDNDPFTTFDDDVGISGGTKRYKIWRVPSSGSNTLAGFVKEVEPSYDLTWYGYEAQVDQNGYFNLASNEVHFWFEPTTSSFTEDGIGVWLHEPR